MQTKLLKARNDGACICGYLWAVAGVAALSIYLWRYTRRMPEISRFLGIVIAMYYRDHAPPHFHAIYGDF
jgi:hypothetical protein